MVVIAVSGGNQWARIADDHSGAPEAFGEHIVVVAAEVGSAAGERREPRRRPGGSRSLLVLTTDRGERGGYLLVGQILDEALQCVPLSAHGIERSPDRNGHES